MRKSAYPMIAQSTMSSGNKFEFRNRLKVAMNIGDIDDRIKDLEASMNGTIRVRTSSQSVLDFGKLDHRSNLRLGDSLRSV